MDKNIKEKIINFVKKIFNKTNGENITPGKNIVYKPVEDIKIDKIKKVIKKEYFLPKLDLLNDKNLKKMISMIK